MSDGGHEKRLACPLRNISFAQKPSRDIRTALDQKHYKNWGWKIDMHSLFICFQSQNQIWVQCVVSQTEETASEGRARKRERERWSTLRRIAAVTNPILPICGFNYNIVEGCKTQQIRVSRIDSSQWQHDSWAGFPTKQVRNCLTLFFSLSVSHSVSP